MLTFVASAETLLLTDTDGRETRLTFFRCPLPACPGLVIRFGNLAPAHLGIFPLTQLCEGLRAGRAWPKLTPSEVVPDLSLVVIRRPGGDEHFMLAYRKSAPELSYFVVSGAAPDEAGFRSAVAIDGAIRRQLADRLTAELVAGEPARASA